MSENVFYVLEIILAILGVGVILAQQHSEEGSSFFATSTQVFKFSSLKDKFLFFATLVIIFAFIVVLTLHYRYAAA